MKFVDFWDGFDTSNDPIFHRLIPEHFDVEILGRDETGADLLVYSVFGTSHRSEIYKGAVKVLYSAENLERFFKVPVGENSRFDELFDPAHFAITMHRMAHRRHFRMPNYIRKYGYGCIDRIQSNQPPREPNKFATFVQRNCEVPCRNDFVRSLMKYKRVDCGGPCMNNMGRTVKDKIEFIRDYKFLVAFENSSAVGYSTEKLFDAFLGGTLPIYWGDPSVSLDFNSRAFLNRMDYGSDEELIEKIIELDHDDDAYARMMAEPKIVDRELFNPERFLLFFENILESLN